MGVVDSVVVEHSPQVNGHVCMTSGSVAQSAARAEQIRLSSLEQSSGRVVEDDAIVGALVAQRPQVNGHSR